MIGSHYGGDREYADSRVTNTIVMHEGRPVTVVELAPSSEGAMATVLDLLNSNRIVTRLDGLDLCPPKIGYVNYGGVASYVCRMPKRRDYKQGTRMQNLVSHCGLPINSIAAAQLYSPIVGDYPDFTTCIQSVGPDSGTKNHSMAWHNDWALSVSGDITYKFGNVVGSLKDSEPKLLPQFKHLQKVLQRSLI
jgi:hypothetical protein